jgi:hypothetical protein
MNNRAMLHCGLIDARAYIQQQNLNQMQLRLSELALSKTGNLLTESQLYSVIEFLSAPRPTQHQRVLFNRALTIAQNSNPTQRERILIKCLVSAQYRGEGIIDHMLSSLKAGGIDIFRIHQVLIDEGVH